MICLPYFSTFLHRNNLCRCSWRSGTLETRIKTTFPGTKELSCTTVQAVLLYCCTLYITIEVSDQRQRDRRPSTTACSGCWAIGTNYVKKCAVRKIIFYNGLTRAAKAEKKSAGRAQRTNHGGTPLKCTPRVPICLSFQQAAGATTFWSLWFYLL